MKLRRKAESHRKKLDKFMRYWVNNDFPEEINPSRFED